jgi:hypothetical protein
MNLEVLSAILIVYHGMASSTLYMHQQYVSLTYKPIYFATYWIYVMEISDMMVYEELSEV